MGNGNGLSRITRRRYVSAQKASGLQVGLIKKLFYQLEKYEKCKMDYSMMNYYEADSLIKTLKRMIKEREDKIKKEERKLKKKKALRKKKGTA